METATSVGGRRQWEGDGSGRDWGKLVEKRRVGGTGSGIGTVGGIEEVGDMAVGEVRIGAGEGQWETVVGGAVRERRRVGGISTVGRKETADGRREGQQWEGGTAVGGRDRHIGRRREWEGSAQWEGDGSGRETAVGGIGTVGETTVGSGRDDSGRLK